MTDKTIPLTSEQKKQIGLKIRKLRMKENYSLEELAAEVKMSVEALSRMESGDFELYDDIPSGFKH